jgi:hypothetical protein
MAARQTQGLGTGYPAPTPYPAGTGGAQSFNYVGGPYGGVPAPVNMPTPYTDLGAVYPNLSGTNAQLSSVIGSQLRGELSADTQAAIQDAAARFGVTSGMPGSGLQRNRVARDFGMTSQQLQQQGIQNYNSLIPTIKGTQTVSPETQIGLNERNAYMAAMPNPGAAAAESERIYQKYLNQAAGGGGGFPQPGMPGGGGSRSGGSSAQPSPAAGTGVFQGTGGGGGGSLFTSAPAPMSPFGTTQMSGNYSPIGGYYDPGSLSYDIPGRQSSAYMPTQPYSGSDFGVSYDRTTPGAPAASFADDFGSVFGGAPASSPYDYETGVFLDNFFNDYGTDFLYE